MTEDIKTPKLSDSTKPAIDYSTCYKLPFLSLYNEDCFETMKRIPDNSVDLMLTDPPYNAIYRDWETDRKSTRLNSSHITRSRMPSSA